MSVKQMMVPVADAVVSLGSFVIETNFPMFVVTVGSQEIVFWNAAMIKLVGYTGIDNKVVPLRSIGLGSDVLENCRIDGGKKESNEKRNFPNDSTTIIRRFDGAPSFVSLNTVLAQIVIEGKAQRVWTCVAHIVSSESLSNILNNDILKLTNNEVTHMILAWRIRDGIIVYMNHAALTKVGAKIGDGSRNSNKLNDISHVYYSVKDSEVDHSLSPITISNIISESSLISLGGSIMSGILYGLVWKGEIELHTNLLLNNSPLSPTTPMSSLSPATPSRYAKSPTITVSLKCVSSLHDGIVAFVEVPKVTNTSSNFRGRDKFPDMCLSHSSNMMIIMQGPPTFNEFKVVYINHPAIIACGLNHMNDVGKNSFPASLILSPAELVRFQTEIIPAASEWISVVSFPHELDASNECLSWSAIPKSSFASWSEATTEAQRHNLLSPHENTPTKVWSGMLSLSNLHTGGTILTETKIKSLVFRDSDQMFFFFECIDISIKRWEERVSKRLNQEKSSVYALSHASPLPIMIMTSTVRIKALRGAKNPEDSQSGGGSGFRRGVRSDDSSVESVTDADIYIQDLGRLVYCNPAASKLLSLEENAAVRPQLVSDLVASVSMSTWLEEVVPRVSLSHSWSGVLQFKNLQNDEFIPTDANVFSVPIETLDDQNTSGSTSYLSSSSDESEYSESLMIAVVCSDRRPKVNRNAFQTIKEFAVEFSTDAIVVCDAKLSDFPIVYANRNWCKMTGFSMPDKLGQNPRFLQGPLTDPRATALMRKALQTLDLPFEIVVVNYRSDSTPFYNHMILSSMDIGTSFEYIGCSSRDITKEVEQHSMLHNDYILGTLLDSVPVPSCFVRCDHLQRLEVIYQNKAMETIFGNTTMMEENTKGQPGNDATRLQRNGLWFLDDCVSKGPTSSGFEDLDRKARNGTHTVVVCSLFPTSQSRRFSYAVMEVTDSDIVSSAAQLSFVEGSLVRSMSKQGLSSDSLTEKQGLFAVRKSRRGLRSRNESTEERLDAFLMPLSTIVACSNFSDDIIYDDATTSSSSRLSGRCFVLSFVDVDDSINEKMELTSQLSLAASNYASLKKKQEDSINSLLTSNNSLCKAIEDLKHTIVINQETIQTKEVECLRSKSMYDHLERELKSLRSKIVAMATGFPIVGVVISILWLLYFRRQGRH